MADKIRRFEELETGRKYQRPGEDEYCTIREDHSGNFYWVDTQNGSLGSTKTPRLSETDIPEYDVDEGESFVGFSYLNSSKESDPSVRKVKEELANTGYVDHGPITE